MSTPLINLVAGGAAIGAAAGLLVLANGQIAGISSIWGQTLRADTGRFAWRAVFLLGLLLPAALATLSNHSVAHINMVSSLPVLAVAGLLVGIGTQRGTGCTSGHGVCGNANFSQRSLAATLTFMATAAITVLISRHLV